ncbi:Protein 21.1 [Giardia lamblia P15]|uniref:Protein 21.1 n=1 Tax=Giardia intestinalis (strain P15) TaxID=658858 RepID=E1F789_GIAIA|nr:Protein 21.1 [Giardia lamblia P15]
MNVEPGGASSASYVRLVKLYIRRLEKCTKLGDVFPSTTIVSMCLKCATLLETLKPLHSGHKLASSCETVDDACSVQDAYAVDRSLYDFLFKLLEIASQVTDNEHVRTQLNGMLGNEKNRSASEIRDRLQHMLSLPQQPCVPPTEAIYNALLTIKDINQMAFQIEQNFNQQMADLYILMRAGKATSVEIENFLNGERNQSNFRFYILLCTYISTAGLLVKINQRTGTLVQWKTALIDAAINNNPEQVYAHHDKLLQQSQEWIDLTANGGLHKDHVKLSSFNLTALMAAAWYGHTECVKLLLVEIGLQDKLGYTALMMAAQNGSIDAALLLLAEAGFSDESGFTALMAAASNGHTEIVAMLASRESRMQNKDGSTALMLATSRNNIDAVRILIEYEAGMCDNDGMTALMVASANGCLQIVGLLYSKEIGYRDKSGWTAMIWAAQRCAYWCMKLLLPYEGEIKDNTGKSPIDHVICSSHGKPLDKQRCLLLLV